MYRMNQLILPCNTRKDTRFLALVGFSLSGPAGTPFIIRENVNPIDVLGECRLAENVKMANRYGINPLILRLNGSHGECVVKHDGSGLDALRFKTIDATDESNNIDLHLFPTYMVVQGLENSQSYYFADYKGLSELVSAIKQNFLLGKGEVDVEVINQVPLVGLCLEERHLEFSGADDGFSYVSNHDGSDSEEKLQSQLALLRENLIDQDGDDVLFAGELGAFQVDTLVFTDISYEKAPADLAYIFGNFASSKTSEQKVYCSAVLSTDSFSEERYTEFGDDTYAEQLTLLEQASMLRNENDEHLKYVEVVVGSHKPANGRYSSLPCAPIYACMRYKLPEYHHSATNKELLHLNSLQGLQLSQDEVANLSGSGYICIVPSIKKGFVPLSSKNLYPEHPLFSKPHYMRSIRYDVNMIAGYFNQYIGEPVTNSVLQSILSQVNSFIGQLKEDHPIYRDIRMEVLEYTQTSLSLAISFDLYGEIEKVSTSFDYVPSSEVSIEW